VHAWRERAGGWTALAEARVRRGGATARMPDNLEDEDLLSRVRKTR